MSTSVIPVLRVTAPSFVKPALNKAVAEPTHTVGANTLSSTPAGTTMGLKESECGQMGVIMMAGTLGWIMEAPAATAYAVLPVGVDTITPEGTETQ